MVAKKRSRDMIEQILLGNSSTTSDDDGKFTANILKQSYLDDIVVLIEDAKRENQVINKEAIADTSEIKVMQVHLIAMASPLQMKPIGP